MRIQQSQRKHPPKVKAKIKLFQRTTKSNINQNQSGELKSLKASGRSGGKQDCQAVWEQSKGGLIKTQGVG